VREKVPGDARDSGLADALLELADFSSSTSRLVVWYSLIYVVVEGYMELRLQDEHVDALLSNDELVGHLRRFRNSVFHYQRDLLSQKHLDFLASEGSELWVRELNRAFERFFLANLPIKEQIAELNALAI
jgi:hypothetical protein